MHVAVDHGHGYSCLALFVKIRSRVFGVMLLCSSLVGGLKF